jgi:hypothetical protein
MALCAFSYGKAVSDLSDAQWTRLRILPAHPKTEGRPRAYSLREVLDAIFYASKSGCPWRLLPHDFLRSLPRLPPFRKIPIERIMVPHPRGGARGREEAGGQVSPTDGGHHGLPKCQDRRRRIGLPERLRCPRENVKGLKRHLLVDALGLFCSRSMSLRPTCKIGSEHRVFWPG